MNNLDQLVKGILEKVSEKRWAKKTQKHELAMTARNVATAILKDHEDDKEEAELSQLIDEGVKLWESHEEAEPNENSLAEFAKKNRLVK